jgi:hypothetical protein
MRFKSSLITIFLLSFSFAAVAQTQSAPNPASGQTATVAVPFIVLRGAFPKGLNSKNAAAGQKFVVKTGEGLKLTNGTEIPAGSDISGHVLQSTARANGAPDSTLVVTFDTLQPKGTTTPLPVRGIVQAVAGPPPVSVASPSVGDMRTESVGGGVTGARVPSNETHGDLKTSDGIELNEKSAGVVGIKNMTLQVGPLNGVDASTFYSADKSVKLEDGSQVMLRIALKP